MNYDNASTREIYWGISHIANVKPQKRRFTAFATIKDNLYISSDGINSYIWDSNGIKQTINLPAIALHYAKNIDHIISSVKNSTHLHFISMSDLSSITVHPISFSIRTITSIFYLSKSGTLVTAGQGVTFSKMALPKNTGKGPFSQLIEFSRSAELYQDEAFTKATPPLFIESEDSVVIPIGKSLFIHSSDGSLIGSMKDLMKGKILSLSYYEEKHLIVIGDELGTIYFVEYGQFFTKITTKIGNNSHILLASLFDRCFLLTVEQDNSLTLINVDTESRIESINIDSDISSAFVDGDRVLIFTTGVDVLIYKISIFTKFLTSLKSNALKIERYMEPKKPSILFCFQKDFSISSFIGKTGKELVELMSSSSSSEIIDFIMDDSSLFLRFKYGNIVRVECVKHSDILSISSNENNLKKSIIKVPQTVAKISQMIKYEKSDGEKCLLALSDMDQILAFSIEKGSLINRNYIGCQELICGCFLKEFKVFVLSTKTEMVLVDSDDLSVVKRTDRSYVTCFFYEKSKSSLFVGDANGCIECFELPSLTSVSRSLDFNKSHTSKGKKVTLSEFKATNEIPFAVKYLSYLKSRNSLISMSNEGEIFLWNSNLFPFAHINFSFGISAGCFYDSNGSLLISTFNCLYIVPYTVFYDHPVDERMIKYENEIFDEFNEIDIKNECPFSSIKIDPNFEIEEEDEEEEVKNEKNELEKKEKELDNIKIDDHSKIEWTSVNQNEEKSIDETEEEEEEEEGEEEEIDGKNRKKKHKKKVLNKKVDKNPKDSLVKIEKEIKSKDNFEKKLSTPSEKLPKPIPPPEKPPIAGPRKIENHKPAKIMKPKKNDKIEKSEFKPKPPPPQVHLSVENTDEENSSKVKKIPAHSYKHFYAKMGPNSNSNAMKDQITEQVDKEKHESGTFSIEIHKRTYSDSDDNLNNHFLHYRPPRKSNYMSYDEDPGNNENEKDIRVENKNTQNSSNFHSQGFEFIEPSFDYGKIGTVTMEEFEDYMKRNAVVIKKPSNQRRAKSLRSIQSQSQTPRLQYPNQHLIFPKITRFQKK